MTRARWGALAVLVCSTASVAFGSAALAQNLPYERAALIILVPDVSFEEIMSLPEVAAMARGGGAGLLANDQDFELPMTPGVPEKTPPGREEFLVLFDSPDLGRQIRDAVIDFPADELLVLILSQQSDEAIVAGDELRPVVMAVGVPQELFPDEGVPGSLTSDSTRRRGVVTGADIRATEVAFLGGPTEEFAGEPIEIVEGPPPFELHERYLAQRRLYVPVGTAGAIYVVLGGLGAITILALGDRVPNRIRRILGWWSLSVPMLAVGMLAVGHLPELSYATAVPMIAIVTVFGTMAFSPLEGRDVALVPFGIGLAALAYLALEAVLGWSGMLTPLLGGSQLDGGRFHGLPNVAIGVLIGSGLWVAHRLRTAQGFALLCGLGLFAGLPYLGTNLGGGVSLFAAAGLWLAVRERRRLGVWRGIGAFVGVTLLGAVAILLAHAIAPLETHVSRFEAEASGLADVAERFADRLQVGFDLIERNPFALIPVIGLPIAIAAVLRPPAQLRPSLERNPAWRDAILVTLLGGVVAYLANDSGPAAAGFAFGMGLGGLLGVSLLLGAEKMVNR